MKVLVTGAGGMLGTDVCADLTARGHTVLATGRREGLIPLDITDTTSVHALLRSERPDAIVHCAAWTDVDGAERDPDGAYRVNALGSWNLATAAAEIRAWLVAVSTDFVFDGQKSTPYTEFDAVNPLGHYGASKEAGERLVRQTLPDHHMIVRTSWLYGVHGKSFPGTILRLARKLPEVPIVTDEKGSPTFTPDLSRKIIDLLENPLPGTYHVCNSGECTRYEMAETLLRMAELSTPLVPITAAEYGTRFNSPTKRPSYSTLRRFSLEMRGMDDLPHWEDGMGRFLKMLPG